MLFQRQGIRPHLEDLYHFVSSISPIVYGITYLCAFFSFGLLFYALPGWNFYSPYMKVEPVTLKAAVNLRETLRRNITYLSETLDPNIPDLYLNAPEWLNIVDASGGDAVTVQFILNSSKGPDNLRVRVSTNFYLSHTGDECHEVSADPGGPFYSSRAEEILKYFFPNNVNCPLGDYLEFDNSDGSEIREYATLFNGYSKQNPDFIVRMFYLSATTITTTGLGDVLPITLKGRLAVGLEPVFGWALSGLFLNAIGWRVTTSRSRAGA